MSGVARSPVRTSFAKVLVPIDSSSCALREAQAHPLWIKVESEHFCLALISWLRYMYGSAKMWRLPRTQVTSAERFSLSASFSRVFGTRRNVEELSSHLKVHSYFGWSRFPLSCDRVVPTSIRQEVCLVGTPPSRITFGTIHGVAAFCRVPRKVTDTFTRGNLSPMDITTDCAV